MNRKPKGWGVWKCPVYGSGGEGWWMRPGRGIVLWRFKAPDGERTHHATPRHATQSRC